MLETMKIFQPVLYKIMVYIKRSKSKLLLEDTNLYYTITIQVVLMVQKLGNWPRNQKPLIIMS